jgi:ribosomal protein S19E (S16A)
LQQLEAAGFIQTTRPRGRTVTKEGRKLLQELAEELAKEMPELAKYKGD